MTSAMQNSLFFGPSFLPGQDGDIRIRRETTRSISDFVIECRVVTAVHSFVSFHSVGGDDGEFHSNHGAFVGKERDDGEFEGRSRFLRGNAETSFRFRDILGDESRVLSFLFLCLCLRLVCLSLSLSHTDKFTRTNTQTPPHTNTNVPTLAKTPTHTSANTPTHTPVPGCMTQMP